MHLKSFEDLFFHVFNFLWIVLIEPRQNIPRGMSTSMGGFLTFVSKALSKPVEWLMRSGWSWRLIFGNCLHLHHLTRLLNEIIFEGQELTYYYTHRIKVLCFFDSIFHWIFIKGPRGLYKISYTKKMRSWGAKDMERVKIKLLSWNH